MKKIMYPQEMGAYTSIFAAAASQDNTHIHQGAYIYPPNIAVSQAPAALDEARQTNLFNFTEELLKDLDI